MWSKHRRKRYYKPKKHPGRAGSNNEEKKKMPDRLEIREQKRMRPRSQCKKEDKCDRQPKQRGLRDGARKKCNQITFENI